MGLRSGLHTFAQMNLICGVCTRHTFARTQLCQLGRPLRSQLDPKPSVTNIADKFSRAVVEVSEGKGGKMQLGADAYSNIQGTDHSIFGNDSKRCIWQWLCTWSQKHRQQRIGDACCVVGSPSESGRVAVKSEVKRRS
eukprot:GHVS01009792.1.p1 GENE.GHVS01009792.1~~GHVS01009792.1.p1  ORF type:complete len:138 (+),score=7.08 GHVS01009792.1:117-530(+)